MCSRSRSFLPGTLHFRRPDGSLADFRALGVRLELAEHDAPMVLLRLEHKKEATAVFLALNRELQKLTTQRRKLNRQRKLIRKQKAEILEFSAPMIDVWDGVLLVPLFGVLSQAYFDRVLTNLLEAVSRKRTRWIILDMTATPSTSALMTASLVRIARAARMLGANCILAGLGPNLAQHFVAHGEIPEELSVAKNLHTALAMCLSKRNNA